MNRTPENFVRQALLWGVVLLMVAPMLQAQQSQAQPSQPTKPAEAAKPQRVVVTFDGELEDMPEVKPEDFQIEIGKQKLPPTRILKPEELPTLLAIVLQDNQPADFGTQLPALRDFITSQPPNTYVGIFYLNGQTINFALPPPHFFSDLPKVAAALRAPNGNREAAPPSPYDKVAQIVSFMDSLPEARKEILLFSEGSDSIAAQANATPQQNKGLVRAIKGSIQAGIPVWVVYAEALVPEVRSQEEQEGPLARANTGIRGVGQSPAVASDQSVPVSQGSFSSTVSYSGISYLSHMAEASGGKVFSPGKFAVDIRPHLAEFQKLLKQQVVLEYQGEGDLKKVKMNRKLRGVKVLAPER